MLLFSFIDENSETPKFTQVIVADSNSGHLFPLTLLFPLCLGDTQLNSIWETLSLKGEQHSVTARQLIHSPLQCSG